MTSHIDEMNWRARQERIQLAAELWLKARPAGYIAGTTELANAVAQALEAPQTAVRDIQRDLTKVAPKSAHARQNGALFQAYGRTMRRWQWYARVDAATDALDIPSSERANRLDPQDVAEFQAHKAAQSAEPADPDYLSAGLYNIMDGTQVALARALIARRKAFTLDPELPYLTVSLLDPAADAGDDFTVYPDETED